LQHEFSTFDVAELLGIKRVALAQWLSRGYIEPSVQKARGRGGRNKFSINDLYQIKFFMRLLESGVCRNDAKMQIGINFDPVGPNADDKKYAVFVKKKQESGNRKGYIHLADDNLERSPVKIVLGEDDEYAVVMNLLEIKNDIDQRVKEL